MLFYGQTHIYQQLIHAVDQGTLPHALLITSSEGRGGLPLAISLAQYIQCPHRNEGKPCGECPSCYKYSKLVHPDLYFIYPVVNKSKTSDNPSISTDFITHWRKALLDEPYITHSQWMQIIGAENKQSNINAKESIYIINSLSIKPYESDYRVMIIWLPEKMNETAANKLLKIIEEPYAKTHIFLVSEEPEKVLGTIVSRTQHVYLPPIDEETLQIALCKRLNVTPERAAEVAHLANGSFTEAMTLLTESEERDYFFDLFCRMMRDSYARKLFAMKEWSEEIASSSSLGREGQKKFLQYAQRLIRENFILNFSSGEMSYLNKPEQQFSSRFSRFIGMHNVEEIMNQLALAEKDISMNVNAKMVFFDLSLRMIMLLKRDN